MMISTRILPEILVLHLWVQTWLEVFSGSCYLTPGRDIDLITSQLTRDLLNQCLVNVRWPNTAQNTHLFPVHLLLYLISKV